MRRRIAIAGLPFFGTRVARSLCDEGFQASYVARPGMDPRDWATTAWRLSRADLVYTIGSSARKWGPVDMLARANKRILMHWAGSDVIDARKDWRAGRISERLLSSAEHWCAAPWLVEELAPLGIRPTWKPLPMVIKTGEELPLPSTFRVLVYHGKLPHRAYNIKATLEVIRAMPHIPFVLVGGYQPSFVPDNLEVVGWVDDMKPQFARTSVLLRMVHHDAMSHSVIEALGYGREVIWNYHVPGVTQVRGVDEAVQAIQKLYEQGEQRTLNFEGMETARGFRPEQIIPAAAEDLRGMMA